MADPFVAEIRMFAGNFAPRNWAFCEGQLLPVSQNTALFSLLGNIYGGNGQTTFALPNLNGRAPVFHGQGPGLSDHKLGEKGGNQTVTLTTEQMPGHTHNYQGTREAGRDSSPAGNLPARTSSRPYSPGPKLLPLDKMDRSAIQPIGGNQPHNNMMPYLTVNFIIALVGVYPPRS